MFPGCLEHCIVVGTLSEYLLNIACCQGCSLYSFLTAIQFNFKKFLNFPLVSCIEEGLEGLCNLFFLKIIMSLYCFPSTFYLSKFNYYIRILAIYVSRFSKLIFLKPVNLTLFVHGVFLDWQLPEKAINFKSLLKVVLIKHFKNKYCLLKKQNLVSRNLAKIRECSVEYIFLNNYYQNFFGRPATSFIFLFSPQNY